MEPNATSEDKRRRRLKIIELILGYTLVLIPLFTVVSSQEFFDKISDLPEYFVVAKMFTGGQGADVYKVDRVQANRHLYFPSHQERELGILSPPMALPIMAPLAFVPLPILQSTWLLASISAVLASTALLLKAFSPEKFLAHRLIISVALFGPVAEALRIGQITPFLLLSLCLCVYYLLKKNDLLAGLFLCAFVIKPQYMLGFGAFMIGARMFKPILASALVFAALTVISLSVLGIVGYEQYIQLLSQMGSPHAVALTIPQITPTIRGQMFLLGLAPAVISVISCLGVALAIIFSACLGVRSLRLQSRREQTLVGIIGVIPLSLLSAPLCHTYDLTLLIPSVMALIFSTPIKQSPVLRSFVIGSLAIFATPILQIIHYGGYSLIVNPFFVCLAVFSVLSAIVAWKSVVIEQHGVVF